MLRLKYMPDYEVPNNRISDCRIIQKTLLQYGYTVSLYDVYQMWDAYSESVCAGWIIIPDNEDEIIRILTTNFDEGEDD